MSYSHFCPREKQDAYCPKCNGLLVLGFRSLEKVQKLLALQPSEICDLKVTYKDQQNL